MFDQTTRIEGYDDEIWAAYARVQVTLNGCG